MLCDFLLSVFCERSAQASEASDAREAIQTHAHSQRFWPCLGFSLCVRPSFFCVCFFVCARPCVCRVSPLFPRVVKFPNHHALPVPLSVRFMLRAFLKIFGNAGALGSHLASKMSQDRVKMWQDRAKMAPYGST